MNVSSDIQSQERVVLDWHHKFFSVNLAAHYVITPEGTILDCNSSFVRLFGFTSRGEALRANVSSLYSDPSDRTRFLELIKKKKQLTEHRSQYVTLQGQRLCVRESAVGEFDSFGNLSYVLGQLIDETTEQRLQEQLIQSQKFETLGTLVGGIAHDFNNILNVILGHTLLMDKWRSNQERFEKSLDAVRKATARGANIAKQLLTFARKIEAAPESVQIGTLIAEVVLLLRETFPERIAFKVLTEPNIPAINADSNQIHQVLLNLCLNARDSIMDAGVITITAKIVGQEALNSHFHDIEADWYVLVEVSDTGSGMDKETLDHIFEPFFTTKKGRGTGLGLSVVYGIVKTHRGFIDVESKVGSGTTFFLYFPIFSQPSETQVMKKNTTEFPKGCGEAILVIEDEELLRDFLKTILEESGYTVLLASNGLEGLQSYRNHMNEVDLVLLDMGLPEMSGTEVLSGLEAFNPNVKVISASGYLEPEVREVSFEMGAVDFLAKPYRVEELLTKIHVALER